MKLFESYSLGDMTLQNRIVMAPMTRSRATDNLPNDLMTTYYRQRNQAGLIITEGTAPSANGLGYPRIPGVFSQDQVTGWQAITSAVHEGGAKMFVQLMHVGRIAHKDNMPSGAEVVAPSAIQADGQMYTDANGEQDHPVPKAMSMGDILQAQQEFVDAAKHAIQAGFDGVELHGANGYLLDQFINPSTNQRQDEYGGSKENRSRFVIETARKVAEAIGAEKTGIRLSPYGVLNDMSQFDDMDDTFVYLAEQLSDLKLVYLHIVDHSGMGAPEVPDAIKAKLRQAFKQTYILSGNYDRDSAEADLQADKGDLVAFGRPFIANPDLVRRLEDSIDLAEPDQSTFYTPGAEGYTDYPAA